MKQNPNKHFETISKPKSYTLIAMQFPMNHCIRFTMCKTMQSTFLYSYLFHTIRSSDNPAY